MEKLKISSPLHANPQQPPLWGQSLQTKKGETLEAACPDATRALVALMDMQAVLGGAASHYGGPAAFAETMSAVHAYMFHQADQVGRPWHELFHFVNDAGHCENGLYALKANYQVAGLDIQALRGFRSLESGLTGHGEAHLFPEGVYISNGPLGSGLPQAQGLAAAESLEKSPRITITAISDGACMEGEAKEALAAIPGLSQKGRLGPFVCIVSDNNTKLSGRIDEDSFSMKPTFDSLKSLGWNVTFVEDGHNLQSVYSHLEKACGTAQTQPQLLWVRTIKGKGVKSAEESASGGHGFPLKKAQDLPAFLEEIFSGKTIPQEMQQWCEDLQNPSQSITQETSQWPGERVKVQKGVSEALIACYGSGLPVVSISADLQGSTGVAGFRSQHPEASFEVGVAESNMVSMAVGLSKQGYIPVVDTFAQFGVTKGALPLIMSGLSQGPIIGIYSHTGFQDAADGASHQALTYLSMVSAIPNVDVICLTCADEAKALVTQCIEVFAKARRQAEVPRSTLFFLGRENYPTSFAQGISYNLGQPQVVSQVGEDLSEQRTLVAAGSMVENALLAQKGLLQESIGSVVINPSTINHVDTDFYKKWLELSGGRLLTIEDHRVLGGMGALLVHALVQAGQSSLKVKSLGVQDHFGRSAYSSAQLYDKFGLGVEDIMQAAREL